MAPKTIVGVVIHSLRRQDGGYAGDGRFNVDGLSGAALEAGDQYLQNLVFKEQMETFILVPAFGILPSMADRYIPPPPSLWRRALRHSVSFLP